MTFLRKTCILLSLALLGLSACRKERIRIKFAGAWEIEKITFIDYSNGVPAGETIYTQCGTWAFVDNGLSDNAMNTSYLSLSQDIPCEFRWALQPVNTKWEGSLDWGADSQGDERIKIEHPAYEDGKSYNVEKIKSNTFIFFSFTQDSLNADKIKQMQRFELKRTNQ